MKQKYLILFLVVSIIFVAGCTTNTPTEPNTQKPETINITNLNTENLHTIKIASFNIQIFGQDKIKKSEVMKIITRIVKEYDLVAIQEVRSTEQNIIPTLLDYINDVDTKYDYVISERLGKTNIKEQYAFVYNTKTVSLIPNSSYVVKDPDDVFEREPFVASFKSGNFDFTMVDNHIKPEDAEAELKHLEVVIDNIYNSSSEKDVIVVGDMNADGKYLNENKLAVILPEWTQMIGNNEDTTVAASDNTYDRMMTRDTTAKVEYTRKSGAFRWDTEYGVTDPELIKNVSDHYPVYAEFQTDLPDDD